jgi:FKBP-type peptidyl-prolyl cis-trans isomerase
MRITLPIVLCLTGLFSTVSLMACGGGDEPRFRPVERSHEEGAHEEGAAAHEEAAAPEEAAPAGALPAPPDVAAVPADAARTESGLASRVLRPGTGTAHPSATSRVRVHYTGWTTDGRMFDSSRTRGEPAEFPLNGVIAGWTEGVQFMVEGEERRFWIPGPLAYGDTPRRPGMPAGMLVFDVELLSIVP